MRLWNLDTGAMLAEGRFPNPLFPEPDDEVASIAFAPSGDGLAFSIRHGAHVFAIDPETPDVRRMSEWLSAHFGEDMPVAWTPDGSHLWAAFPCGRGELWCMKPEKGAECAEVGEARLPRFGGSIGIIYDDEGVHAGRLRPLLQRRDVRRLRRQARHVETAPRDDAADSAGRAEALSALRCGALVGHGRTRGNVGARTRQVDGAVQVLELGGRRLDSLPDARHGQLTTLGRQDR